MADRNENRLLKIEPGDVDEARWARAPQGCEIGAWDKSSIPLIVRRIEKRGVAAEELTGVCLRDSRGGGQLAGVCVPIPDHPLPDTSRLEPAEATAQVSHVGEPASHVVAGRRVGKGPRQHDAVTKVNRVDRVVVWVAGPGLHLEAFSIRPKAMKLGSERLQDAVQALWFRRALDNQYRPDDALPGADGVGQVAVTKAKDRSRPLSKVERVEGVEAELDEAVVLNFVVDEGLVLAVDLDPVLLPQPLGVGARVEAVRLVAAPSPMQSELLLTHQGADGLNERKIPEANSWHDPPSVVRVKKIEVAITLPLAMGRPT